MDQPTKQPPVALLQSIHLEHLQASEETTGEKHILLKKAPKINRKNLDQPMLFLGLYLSSILKGFEARISIKVELLVSK